MNLFRRIIGGPRLCLAGGVLLLILWVVWWALSLAEPLPSLWPGPPAVARERISNIYIWPFVGIDFQHNYAAASTWLAGHDPYVLMQGDPMNAHYVYPPLTLFAFSWVAFFPPQTVTTWLPFSGPAGSGPFPYCLPAVFIWMGAITLIAGLAAWQTWRVRERLRLPPLPLPFILGATLISYPVMFELERGNCDVLPLLALALLVPALAFRHRFSGDLLVALCVAFATGIKAYPGVLLLGLVALRRYRAAALSAILLVVQVAVWWHPFQQWLAIVRSQSGLTTPGYMFFSHSLLVHWRLIWETVGLPAAARIPGGPVVAALVLAAVLAVSWKVFRARPEADLAWPYLLWLVTMGTMVNIIAQDYSLLYLPFAVLAAWDPRDSWRIQLCLAPMLLWWLPLSIGINGLPLLLLKVAGIFLVGVLVARRLRPAATAA